MRANVRRLHHLCLIRAGDSLRIEEYGRDDGSGQHRSCSPFILVIRGVLFIPSAETTVFRVIYQQLRC